MNKFLNILRDPNATPPAGGTPPASNDIPKDKEGWDKLAKDNPTRWIELTQPRMDQAIRESREWKEKATQTDTKYKNLETEFNTLRQKIPVTPSTNDNNDDGENQPFSRENLPKTKDQWDGLFIEDPTLATDLRQFKNEQDRIVQTNQTREHQEFESEHKKHRTELQSRHSDMYKAERNSDGTVKLDGNGKPVLIIDPKSGEPEFDESTEKGKLFAEIFNEDPKGYSASKKGPRLLMLEMERRLKEKGEAQVNNAGGGQQNNTSPDQRGTMPGGVPPPITAKVSFSSDEEKQHAEKAVQRGVYRSVEEYCQLRDGKNIGIYDENRTPQFGSKK